MAVAPASTITTNLRPAIGVRGLRVSPTTNPHVSSSGLSVRTQFKHEDPGQPVRLLASNLDVMDPGPLRTKQVRKYAETMWLTGYCCEHIHGMQLTEVDHPVSLRYQRLPGREWYLPLSESNAVLV